MLLSGGRDAGDTSLIRHSATKVVARVTEVWFVLEGFFRRGR